MQGMTKLTAEQSFSTRIGVSGWWDTAEIKTESVFSQIICKNEILS
jgi:hypothetical protein